MRTLRSKPRLMVGLLIASFLAVAGVALADQLVSTAAAVGGNVAAFNCSSSAPTALTSAFSQPIQRKNATIQNLGTTDIYLGFTSGVTTATGFKVPAGGVLSIDLGSAPTLYCLAASADQVSPNNTRFMEVR